MVAHHQSPHRQSPDRARERSELAWALAEVRLAGFVICPRCKATVASIDDRCSAPPDAASCPGVDAYQRAYRAALDEIAARGRDGGA